MIKVALNSAGAIRSLRPVASPSDPSSSPAAATGSQRPNHGLCQTGVASILTRGQHLTLAPAVTHLTKTAVQAGAVSSFRAPPPFPPSPGSHSPPEAKYSNPTVPCREPITSRGIPARRPDRNSPYPAARQASDWTGCAAEGARLDHRMAEMHKYGLPNQPPGADFASCLLPPAPLDPYPPPPRVFGDFSAVSRFG
jgi:hypothetical protein